MSEIFPHDLSRCYFCNQLIFPIRLGKQQDLNNHDSAKFQDGEHHRFHNRCLTERQKHSSGKESE